MFAPLRFAGLGLLLAAVALAGASPDDAPLTEEGVTRLVVTLKIKPEAVAGMVRSRGLGFEADAAALERLKKAGVPDPVLDAIREKGKKPDAPAAGTAPAVTFDQVAEMLKFGVPEADMKEAIKGTVFTFSKDQVDQLKKLGAGDSLIKDLSASRSIDTSLELANLALLIDCSGSMSELTPNGSTKMDAAKKAAIELIRKVPAGMYLSLIIYGHDQALRCDAVKVARPLGPLDDAGRSQLIQLVGTLVPAGSTPIDLALVTAGKELAKAQGPSGVVLISDGKEMCGGNPSRAASNLAKALKLGFGVQVVGFGVKPDEKVALGEIAQAGQGSYFDAPTPEKLQDVALLLARAVQEGKKPVSAPVIEEEPEAPMTPKVRVLAEQLRDKSYEVSQQAAEALGRMGEKARGAANALIERLGDENCDGYRESTASKDAALTALKKIAPGKVEAGLMAGARSKNAESRYWALGQTVFDAEVEPLPIPNFDEAKRRWVECLAFHLKAEDFNNTRRAAESLGRIGDPARVAADALADRIADENCDGYRESIASKNAALDALKKLAPAKVEEALFRGTKSKSEATRAWATKKLVDEPEK